MKKGWHKYLVYLSLGFLIFALYKADYLHIPHIHSYPYLCLSFTLLFLGFLGQVWSWHAVLAQSTYKADYLPSLVGTGLSVFTKFIPGKIMVIVGRAAYVAEHYQYPVSQLSMLSLNTQLIALWSGLCVGTSGLFFLEGFDRWRWLILSLFMVLSIFIFVPQAYQLLEKILSRLLKKNIQLPKIDPRAVIKVLPVFFAYWLCWAAAFYCLAKALSPEFIAIAAGLSFPLAVTLGIMAIIAPGGIGIRESVIVGCLTLAGSALSDATTISVSSRLWFLVGESFIFLVGFVGHRYLKRD